MIKGSSHRHVLAWWGCLLQGTGSHDSQAMEACSSFVCHKGRKHHGGGMAREQRAQQLRALKEPSNGLSSRLAAQRGASFEVMCTQPLSSRESTVVVPSFDRAQIAGGDWNLVMQCSAAASWCPRCTAAGGASAWHGCCAWANLPGQCLASPVPVCLASAAHLAACTASASVPLSSETAGGQAGDEQSAAIPLQMRLLMGAKRGQHADVRSGLCTLKRLSFSFLELSALGQYCTGSNSPSDNAVCFSSASMRNQQHATSRGMLNSSHMTCCKLC